MPAEMSSFKNSAELEHRGSASEQSIRDANLSLGPSAREPLIKSYSTRRIPSRLKPTLKTIEASTTK